MSPNIIFIILLIFESISLSNSKMVIPFKIKNFDHPKGQNEFILNYFYKNLVINLLVGTPPQAITLSACLGEYNTFIVDKSCKGYNKGIYNRNNSSTYKPLVNQSQTFVFEIYDRAIMAKETFIFGNNEIKDYRFINALEIDDDYPCYDTYCEVLTEPGILGFLIQPHANAEYNFSEYNFIHQLKRKNLISRYEFYFDFNSNDSGNIIIGSLPNETENENELYKYTIFSTITISKVDFSLDWAFQFDDIYYGEEKINRDIKRLSMLRVEFGFIKGNFLMEDYVKNDFFDGLIGKKCTRKNTNDLGTSIYYYYCDKDIDLSKFKPWKFAINDLEMNFTFTKDDLFLDIGDKYIFLMTFGGVSEIYLGYPFLKKYKIIFNQDSKTIGYFHKKPKAIEDKTPIVYIIMISILSVIFIVLAAFALYYFLVVQKKKKMAKELTDEVDKTKNNEGLIPNEDESTKN